MARKNKINRYEISNLRQAVHPFKTVQEVAELADMKPSEWMDFELEPYPGAEVVWQKLDRVAQVLGVDPCELLTDSEVYARGV